MNEGQQAIPPRTYPEFIQKAVQATENIKPEPREEDEKVLLDLSTSDAWKIVKKYITNVQKEVNENAKVALRKSPHLEEIGLYSLIADQIESALQAVVDMVERPSKTKVYERITTDER